MNDYFYNNSVGSKGSSKIYKTSIKSNLTKKTKSTKPFKKKSPKIYEVDNTKNGIDLTKFNKTKEKFNCSFCRNLIMKSALNFSCKHILCANCISRHLLKDGLDKMQSKINDDIFNLECPCNSGNVEITIENLISLLYIHEECLSHGEFKTCPKCSMWSSLLTDIKKCSTHNIINSKNVFDNIINEYCLDCKKELCCKCKEDLHKGHSIKTIQNIVKDIHNFKLKNKNFEEFSHFFENITKDFNQNYDKEFNLNISIINETIKLLNQIKNDFIEKMNNQIEYSRNIFNLLKYIYYFYYKDLATVQNDINVINFLFQNKYELQNISFYPKKEFSQKINNLYELIKNLKIETFDCKLNIKSNFSYCSKTINQAHNGYIFDLLNINDKYLLSAGEDRKINIWSLNPMNLFAHINLDSLEHTSSVFSLCIQKNGNKFFSGSYGEIKIWSTEDFNLINTLYGHKGYISHMEIIQKKIDPFLNNIYKDYLCTCSYDNTIKIWDYDILNCVCTLSGHTDQINYFMETEPGFMISCSSDKTIKFWNIEEEKCYLSLNEAHDSPIYSLAITEEGKIVSSSFSKINIYDLNNKKSYTFYSENNKGVYKLLMLPGNKLISSSFKCINFWDINKYQWLYSIEGHNNYITCLLLYNDKLISAGDDGNINLWE